MAQQTILVVEDDENILELITYHLKKAGFDVQQTFTGEEAIERASIIRPDLILLDLMLPSISGLEVCAQLKSDATTRMIPIVIVSARGADTDVVAGLEAGADDYVVKPFRPRALVANVHTVLRRAACPRPKADQDIAMAGLSICPKHQSVRVADVPVILGERAFQVLHYLILHAGCICTRGQIRTALGIDDDDTSEFSVDDQVTQVRQQLGDAGTCIETVRRIGYRLKDPGA